MRNKSFDTSKANVFQKYLIYENMTPSESYEYVLEGYENIEGAKEAYNLFFDRDVIRYTAHGYEVTPHDLLVALKIDEIFNNSRS